MRQRIAWEITEHINQAATKEGLAASRREAVRLSIFSVLATAPAVIAIQYILPKLPLRIYWALWCAVIFLPVACALEYLFQRITGWLDARGSRARTYQYAVSRHGVRWSDSIRPWSHFFAFNIELHAEQPEIRKIVFFGRNSLQYRLTLPEEALADLVIRFVAKHIPPVEELSESEVTARKVGSPPVWMRWLVGAMNSLYGLALGYLLKGLVVTDYLKLLLLAVFLINPATLAYALGWWSGWLRLRRIECAGWWLAFSLISVLTLIVGALVVL